MVRIGGIKITMDLGKFPTKPSISNLTRSTWYSPFRLAPSLSNQSEALPYYSKNSASQSLEAFHHIFSKNIEIKDTLFLQKQVLKTFCIFSSKKCCFLDADWPAQNVIGKKI